MTIRVGPAGTRGRGFRIAVCSRRCSGSWASGGLGRIAASAGSVSARGWGSGGPSHHAWSEDGADPVGVQASEQGGSGGGVTDI